MGGGGFLLLKTFINNFRHISKERFLDPRSPPPMNFVHGSHNYHNDIIGDVAAELGPLACPSRSARPPSLS